MSSKRIGVIAAAVAVAAGGTGAAIAATGGGSSPRDREQAVLSDAAKRLDVTPDKLRGALSQAEDAQLDQAVKDKKLTQARADAIKQRRKDSGLVLGHGGGPRMGMRHHGFGRMGGPGPSAFFSGAIAQELATALGVERAELRKDLRAGKSIADIASEHGKSLDAVRSTLRAAAKTRLGEAVKDKKVTQAQADEILEHVNRALEHLDEAPPLGRGAKRLHFRGGPGGAGGPHPHPGFGPPPPPDGRPGAFPAPPPPPGSHN